MRVRFVLCHPTNYVGGEERQVFLADSLLAAGHDAAVYAISINETATVQFFNEYKSEIRFFAPDDVAKPPHHTISSQMSAMLIEEAPDLIVVKGIDYAQARLLFRHFPPERLAVIIGGVFEHELLQHCRLIYFETSKQEATYKGPATTNLLPKWIPWQYIREHGVDGIEFDIINVGNFDEDRKAQELLLPFVFTHRVVFVGAGRRLECFREICRDRDNAVFTGFLEPQEVFGYLSRSRLMVHSSTWDGYPRAVAEGMAAGLPVIGLSGVLDGIVKEPLIRCALMDGLQALVYRALDKPDELGLIGKMSAALMRSVALPTEMSSTFHQMILK